MGSKKGYRRVIAPKNQCDVWCWHGVLLRRTKSVQEQLFRVRKRVSKYSSYNKQLEWENVEEWPWI